MPTSNPYNTIKCEPICVALCVTAYLDLELSFQGLEFHVLLSTLRAPSCVPCLCLQAQRAAPPRVRAWLSPRGNAEPCQISCLSYVALLIPGSTVSAPTGSYQSAVLCLVGDEASSSCRDTEEPFRVLLWPFGGTSPTRERFVDWQLLISQNSVCPGCRNKQSINSINKYLLSEGLCKDKEAYSF